MSLVKLIVGGFKSLRERTEIPIAPVTLLFGPNSAGKSAVLGAIDELEEWLREGDRDARGFDRGLKALLSPGHPSAFQPPISEHHGREDDVGEESEQKGHTPMVFGLEIDELNTEECRIWARSFDRVVETGLEAYRTLTGKSLSLEHTSNLGGAYYGTQVATGGEEFLQLVDVRVLLGNFPGHPAEIDLSHFTAPSTDGAKKSVLLDAIRLNLNHPALDGTALIREARALSRLEHHPDLHGLLGVNEGWLTIRTATTERGPLSWEWVHLRGTTLADAIKARAEKVTDSSEVPILRQALDLCNLVVDGIAIFFEQLRFSALAELKFGMVPGDRRVLSAADTLWDFRGSRQFRQTRGNGPGFPSPEGAVATYAQWLAEKAIGGFADRKAEQAPASERDDFVNDVFCNDLFASRRFRVRPEVWRITETQLLSRERSEDESEPEETVAHEYLRVSLFVEDAGGRRLDFDQVGSGVSYVLPVLASLWEHPRSWIQQPELHLHPAAQCELGDAFIRGFNRGHFSVVETHSEHLLLRVLRRVRQTANGTSPDRELSCLPEVIAVLYFDPQEDGSTSVTRLRVTRSGDFSDRWPAGFFEERDKELFDE